MYPNRPWLRVLLCDRPFHCGGGRRLPPRGRCEAVSVQPAYAPKVIGNVTAVQRQHRYFRGGVAMATWSSLTEYVRSRYKIADEKPGSMKLIFDVGDLRSQVVFLWRMVLLDGEE